MSNHFDLELAIHEWRTQFSTAEGISTSQVAELEDHLRDSITALTCHDLNLEEAFLVSRHRLGGDALLPELQRAEPQRIWASRAKWMFLGVLGFHVLSSMLQIVASAIQTALTLLKPGLLMVSTGTVTAGIVTLAIFAWSILRLADGRWRVDGSTWTAALEKPWLLALLMVLLPAFGKLAVYLHAAAAYRALSLDLCANMFVMNQFSGVIEAALVLLCIVFALQRASRLAES